MSLTTTTTIPKFPVALGSKLPRAKHPLLV